MRPFNIVLGPMDAADADGICTAQTINGEANLNGALVSGGVATLDVARRVEITGTASTTAEEFTITGTDRFDDPITETVTGPTGATSVNTELDFKTVTKIETAATTTADVTIGTNAIASTRWYPIDYHRNPINVQLQVVQEDGGGSATWSIEETFDNVMRSKGPFEVQDGPSGLSAQSASADGVIDYNVTAFRLTTSAYTNPAKLTIRGYQSGLVD